MGFFAPLFLGGLALLGLPVYIHLLQQYRQQPVRFSSLMFFERRTQSSIKHRRLKYLLLFALRCAFVALLALAFARPYIHSSAVANVGAGRNFVLALDNSFSMRQGDRFARAKEAALAQLNNMREGDKGQVVTFGGPAKLLTDMTRDKQALRAAIASLEPGDDASSYSEISRVLRSTSESLKANLEAHIFTDNQKSSLPASFADLHLDPGTNLTVHSFASDAVPNWTIENVDAPRRVFDTKKVRTVATVAGFLTTDSSRTVSLVANGKTLESKQVKVPAGGRATVEFLSLDAPYGLTRCEVRIDSADKFPNDDHWFFSVERLDPKPGLMVRSEGDTASPLYVRTALESATDAAFTLDVQSAAQAANSTLSKYAFVIVSDLGPIPQSLADALTKYVQSGGSVMLVLGHNTPPGRRLPVADLPINAVKTIFPDRGETVQSVSQVDTSYPSFAHASNWDGVQIFQFATVQTPPDAPDVRVAARMANGLPLLVDRKVGEGHVLIFASAFDNVANNLPLQPVWLPFVEQTTHEMGGVGSARANYRVGSYVELRTVKEKNVPVEITGPDNKRLLSLSESAKAETFQFPSEGFFDIRRAGGREELAAVNADRRESDFTLVPAETLNLWKNTGVAPPAGSSSSSGTNTRENSAELWWWVLALLAMLAVAESVLGNRYMATNKETA